MASKTLISFVKNLQPLLEGYAVHMFVTDNSETDIEKKEKGKNVTYTARYAADQGAAKEEAKKYAQEKNFSIRSIYSVDSVDTEKEENND